MGAAEVLAIAVSQIGVKELPPDSNRVKFNTAYYGREISGSAYPWCCVFLWWCFREAGLAELFFSGGKTASCTALYHDYRKKGQAVTGLLPGDLVFFDFSGGQSVNHIQHIGIVERVEQDGTLVTIEGNTGTGNDANGGAVMRRSRARKWVAACARPNNQEGDMTRDDVTKLIQDEIAKALSERDDGVAQHRNRPVSGWHAGEWADAQRLGLMDGTNPARPATREQLAAVAVRLYALCREGK